MGHFVAGLNEPKGTQDEPPMLLPDRSTRCARMIGVCADLSVRVEIAVGVEAKAVGGATRRARPVGPHPCTGDDSAVDGTYESAGSQAPKSDDPPAVADFADGEVSGK